MAIRLLTSFGTGAVVTFALLWLMQILIATGKEALTDKTQFSFVDFVRVKQEELIEQKKPKPDKPPEVEDKPPEAPPPELDLIDQASQTFNFRVSSGKVDIDIGMSGFSSDGEYLPIVRIEPTYPSAAQRRGLEGYCDMEFTVTKTGEVTNAQAIECSSNTFKNNSIKAVLKWKYKPRVVNGEPIDSPGVRTRLTYQFED
jgi:protein TonB